MKFSKILMFAAVFAIWGMLSGCGSNAGAFCAKVKECNALFAQSVSECEEKTLKRLDGMTSGQRNDWEKKAADCLGFSGCANFGVCSLKLIF